MIQVDSVQALVGALSSGNVPPEKAETILGYMNTLQGYYQKKNDLLEEAKMAAYALIVGVQPDEVLRFGLDYEYIEGPQRKVIPLHWDTIYHWLPRNLNRYDLSRRLELSKRDNILMEDIPIGRPPRQGYHIHHREEWAMKNIVNVVTREGSDERIPLKYPVKRLNPLP